MRRRSLWIVVLTCLLPTGTPQVAGATPAQPAPSSRAAAPTVIRRVDPLSAAGLLSRGYTITHRYPDASCVAGAPTTGTAYQCFSAQSREGVFDTCWVQANPKFVTCLQSPWTRHATRLHVTGGYSSRGGFHHVAAPWGVRLRSGPRCVVDLGSVKEAAGHPIAYHCQRRIVLTGAVTRGAAIWRAHAYRRVPHKGAASTFTSLGRLPVSVGWLGRASRRA